MSNVTALARPYAVAAFEFAKEHNAVEAWQRLLSTVSDVFAQEDMQKALANPKLKETMLAQALVESLGEQLTAEQQNFVFLLAQNKRLKLWSQISHLFSLFVSEFKHVRQMSVTTARALSEGVVEELKKGLASSGDAQVELGFHVAPDIEGGVVLRQGDTVFDGSIATKLDKLAIQLKR